MTTAMHRRIANLEREADSPPPRIVSVVLCGIEPEIDDNGRKYGPGRVVTRIELVDLQPMGAKP